MVPKKILVALALCLGAAPFALACDGVQVQAAGHGCFVQQQAVAVQTFAPVQVQTFAVAAPVQVATVQTFAAPVCVQAQAHCGGGVNVQAFGGGHGRQRIFGGGTRVRVRVRN